MSIGGALAEARRQAGLTVSQVSQRTRIRETIIADIEDSDYSACGGDFYARGHIRSIARVVGVDPEPLIREYDTAQMPPPEAFPEDVTEPLTAIRPRGRHRLNWIAALAVVVTLGFLGYHFATASPQATSAATPARAHPVSHHHASHASHGSHGTPAPAPKPTPQPAAPALALTPASVVAFSAGGAGQGDNPQLAGLTIDGNPATAWHTDWYTTARFGNLYAGTGLLVDMGRPVTITAAQITLGSASGADFQLRAGAAPALADLPVVANASNAAGVVHLPLTVAAHSRYVLIWFTSLPPDPSGTFQASVYDVRLEGRA